MRKILNRKILMIIGLFGLAAALSACSKEILRGLGGVCLFAVVEAILWVAVGSIASGIAKMFNKKGKFQGIFIFGIILFVPMAFLLSTPMGDLFQIRGNPYRPVFGSFFPFLLPASASLFMLLHILWSWLFVLKGLLAMLACDSLRRANSHKGLYFIPFILCCLADIIIGYPTNKLIPSEIKYMLIVFPLGTTFLGMWLGSKLGERVKKK